MRSVFLNFLLWVKELRVLSSKNSFSRSSSTGSDPGFMDWRGSGPPKKEKLKAKTLRKQHGPGGQT